MRLLIFGLLISCGPTTKPPVRFNPQLCHEDGFDVVMGEVYRCEFEQGTYNCYRKPDEPDRCVEVRRQ